MLDRQGFAHYSTLVRPVIKSVMERLLDASITEILTVNYRVPVMIRTALVKGFYHA